MKLEFSRYIFEKLSNIKHNKNPSCGNRFFFYADGQKAGGMDIHDEAASNFSQFYERDLKNFYKSAAYA